MKYSGNEVFFDQGDLIVSKTDLKGRITYANRIFLEIAGYDEREVIGKAHNVIRHPNMPRGIFELFWQTIADANEIFAYVVNATRSGDHYWVVAHVTPSFRDGRVVGYHSTRRVPNRTVITEVIEPLYDQMNQLEREAPSIKSGTAKSLEMMQGLLSVKGVSYDEFVSSLMREH
ncbi:PAS domain-containing protein [Sneathiella chinensis]|uniref:Transcriptional regulator n=1 Tax=Sneathiella chinensis TaxID=349750 RepID=A0ABQ5U6Y8_9PROT|nr:PAS domain S-box protein [Sneathiella chinensis]GLQ06925.1 transcriptional regulator [Sneathiella chinensis]